MLVPPPECLEDSLSKIGIASLIGVEPIPFADLVRWCVAHGVEAIEANVGPAFPAIGGADFPGHLDLARIVSDGPGVVEDALGDSGVKLTSLAPMLNLLTANLAVRAERIAAFRLAIDA